MKQYHSIPHINQSKLFNHEGFSFYKYDGSNLRFEWNKKQGWYKFGTRHQLFDKDTPLYNQSLPLLYEMSDSIISILHKNFKFDSFICYAEFLGENSFAGSHDSNEPKKLILFDINIYKYGLIDPEKFVNMFSNESYCAKLLYTGKLTTEYVESVKYDSSLNEGVIFKSGVKHNIQMTKIKTLHYLEKLKQKYGNNWEQYV